MSRSFSSSATLLTPMTTVARQQQEFFQEQWRQWRDQMTVHRHGANPLLKYTPIRVAFLQRSLQMACVTPSRPVKYGNGHQPLAGYNILDVGCGLGFVSKYLAALGARVHGIDVESTVIRHNKEENTMKSLTYEAIAVEDLLAKKNWTLCSYLASWFKPQPIRFACPRAQQYDIIVASEVLEHVDNPRFFLKVLDALLKPEGLMMVTTPERTPLSRFVLLTVAEKMAKMISPKDGHYHHHRSRRHGHSPGIQGTHQYGLFVKARELSAFLQGRPIPRGPLVRLCDGIKSVCGDSAPANGLVDSRRDGYSGCSVTEWIQRKIIRSPLDIKKPSDCQLSIAGGKYVPIVRAGAFYFPLWNRWMTSDYLSGISYLYSFKKLHD